MRVSRTVSVNLMLLAFVPLFAHASTNGGAYVDLGVVAFFALFAGGVAGFLKVKGLIITALVILLLSVAYMCQAMVARPIGELILTAAIFAVILVPIPFFLGYLVVKAMDK